MRFFKFDHRCFHRIIIGYSRPFHNLAYTQITTGLVDPCSHHPWPEWLDLIGMLVKKGYFGESLMISKESNHIRTACLNFARHRFTLVRDLSKKDIKVIVGCGCPSIDRKVVNSGKRLRAYVGIDEANVCGSCNLRGKCERAYAQAREDEGARTIDVMRILLTHGLDSISPTVENRACQTKLVEDSVRKLLRESVAYSLKDVESVEIETAQDELQPNERDPQKRPGDWHCTECKFLNFAKNIRCLRCDVFSEERLKQLREEQKDHLPLKKGDWICQTCNFLNFSKNTRCLRCKDKPTMRQINPGEWECESCNYINFRRNSICLKCDHKRQKVPSVTPDSKTVADRHTHSGVSKSWSFVEEDSEEHCNGEKEEEGDGFMGFPVEGGRSNVSRSAEKREQWKLEMMTQKVRSNGTEAKHDTKKETESRYYDQKRRKELLGNITDDDGEMDDWFVLKEDRSMT
ncbi:PREDICTED: zinc finger protein VAR3, chloroplastic-like [Camelina sativa]|uniref:Zinc finger protein VAR3, chloroplastic-like n=1 Tax=Camelina sativa TaxID=90675 RepID=A0ABM0TKS7_CAMSA|nr:PREDICTED: zinc finger protein VAR3, chloroplastic-like [Camelina sativa]